MIKESERELLELAAKAAGMDLGDPRNSKWFYCEHGQSGSGIYEIQGNLIQFWNPLTDDGDALRLAVKLRISIIFFAGFGEVKAEFDGEPEVGIFELYGDDDRAATRLAISRAAAEIGRKMP